MIEIRCIECKKLLFKTKRTTIYSDIEIQCKCGQKNKLIIQADNSIKIKQSAIST